MARDPGDLVHDCHAPALGHTSLVDPGGLRLAEPFCHSECDLDHGALPASRSIFT